MAVRLHSRFFNGHTVVRTISSVLLVAEQSKDIPIVFLDISKAFDKVWHKGLLYKLQQFGIQGCWLKWFENYLSNRVLQVLINGHVSDWERGN